jgi:hypothetical protein
MASPYIVNFTRPKILLWYSNILSVYRYHYGVAECVADISSLTGETGYVSGENSAPFLQETVGIKRRVTSRLNRDAAITKWRRASLFNRRRPCLSPGNTAQTVAGGQNVRYAVCSGGAVTRPMGAWGGWKGGREATGASQRIGTPYRWSGEKEGVRAGQGDEAQAGGAGRGGAGEGA